MTATTGREPALAQREPSAERRPHPSTNLHQRYGVIGIPAVAAALPYAGVTKNPRHATTDSRIDGRFVEAVG